MSATPAPSRGRSVPSAVAVAGLLALLGVPAALGALALFDAFEDETAGPLAGQDGWSAGSGEIQVVSDPAGGLNQVLFVPSDSSVLRKSLAFEDLSVPDGTQRMMFLRLRVGNKQTFSLGLSPLTSPYEYSDFGPEIGMANSTPNLNLRIWEGAADHYVELTPLQPDTWYNLWVWVDTAANTYSLWLNTAVGGAATAADRLVAAGDLEEFGFRTGTSSPMRTFYIKTSGGSSGENFGPLYLDDIYIETDDALNLANPTVRPGDVNCDGHVDTADIDAFVLAVVDPAGYAAQWPGCPAANADCNGDGQIDTGDIDAFVGLVVGG
jgi:hypothetical protein